MTFQETIFFLYNVDNIRNLKKKMKNSALERRKMKAEEPQGKRLKSSFKMTTIEEDSNFSQSIEIVFSKDNCP